MENTSILLKKISIGNLTCQNRFAVNAMECNDADEYGNPSKNTLNRYKRFFKANPGLIDLEAITVTDIYRGRKNQLSVLPKNEKSLKEFVKKLKKINPNTIFFWG